jgi:HEAT repeat protein
MVSGVVIDAMGHIGSMEALEHLARTLCAAPDFETFVECLRAVGKALLHHPDDASLRRVPAWSSSSSADGQLVGHLARVFAANAREDAVAQDLEAKTTAAVLVRALKLRSLYGALVRAGRDPSLSDAIQFCVVFLGRELGIELRAALTHDEAAVRSFACRCVGALAFEDLGATVEHLLEDSDETVRAAAVQTVAQLRYQPAIHALVRALEDRREAVRRAAVAALCEMDAEATTTAVLGARLSRDFGKLGALEIMRANPVPAQRPLIEGLLGDRDERVRRSAIQALVEQPGCDLVEQLTPLLADASLEVRREAVAALGQAKTRKQGAFALVVEQLDKDDEMRLAAVRALGTMGDPSICPRLCAMFDGEPPLTRLAILHTLAELRNPAAEPLLVRLLANTDPEVRRTAVVALAKFGTRAARAHVVAAARDSEWHVRAAAADVLSGLAGAAARAALERLCIDANPFVAARARQHLAVLEET